jgi:hypothetical protein
MKEVKNVSKQTQKIERRVGYEHIFFIVVIFEICVFATSKEDSSYAVASPDIGTFQTSTGYRGRCPIQKLIGLQTNQVPIRVFCIKRSQCSLAKRL